jgi:hypothetical protein
VSLKHPDRHAIFRATPHGVVRYVRLTLTPEQGNTLVKSDRDTMRLPIRSLPLGPTPYVPMGINTLKALCHASRFEDDNTITPIPSGVPLRR